MKFKTVAILMILSGVAITVFTFAPIVYSPKELGECVTLPCHKFLVAFYESPSCAVFGIGTDFDNLTMPSSYHFGCTFVYIPPK